MEYVFQNHYFLPQRLGVCSDWSRTGCGCSVNDPCGMSLLSWSSPLSCFVWYFSSLNMEYFWAKGHDQSNIFGKSVLCTWIGSIGVGKHRRPLWFWLLTNHVWNRSLGSPGSWWGCSCLYENPSAISPYYPFHWLGCQNLVGSSI